MQELELFAITGHTESASMQKQTESNIQFQSLPKKNFSLSRRLSHFRNTNQKDELIRMNQLANLGQLTSALSHELATPLTSIKINLDLLQAELKSHEAVEIAISSVDRIDSLIQSYLHQAKNSQTPKTFDIKDEIKSALILLGHKMNKQDIQVKLSIQSHHILGISNKFAQVITNILKNSIEAFPETQPRKEIAIKTKRVGESLIISIKDNGIGIPMEDTEKIFRNFYTSKQSQNGTGLGLSISKEIVEREFNGTIKLVKNQNPTTFWISLPIK